jgi:putative ATP-dependent endonuclease of OLD family
MRVLSLKVKNFRAFEGIGEEVKILLNNGITVIVGENNVGKSSLLRALRIIAAQISFDNRDFHKGERGNERILELEFQIDRNELKKFLNYITGNSKFLKDQENLKRFTTDLGNHFILSISRYGLTLQTEELMFRSNHLQLKEHNATRFTHNKLDIFFESYLSDKKLTIVDFLRKKVSRIVDKSNGFFIEVSGNPAKHFQEILRQKLKVFSEIRKRPAGSIQRVLESLDGGEVASVLFSLKNGNRKEQKRYEDIKREFTKLFENLELDVRLGEGNSPLLFIEKKSIDFDMPIENVGAGIGEMIILLTHLIASKDVIFGLDLPEMQFHPHAQRLLLKILEEHAKSNQIIMVTHSPLLLNPKNLKNIVIIRERKGKSVASQLEDKHFTKDELIIIERLLLSDKMDFFFSRATLIVEGPTEVGAMPLFSEKIGFDFDTNGISIIKMNGNHFGLWDKLLNGFDIPHAVMCDKDAIMNIDGSIKCKGTKVKTSPVFCSLNTSNRLSGEDKEKILDFQKQIINVDEKESYPETLFVKLKTLVETYNVFVLSSDFEGILEEKGFGKFLKEASSISRSKVIQGRIVAEKIIKQEEAIPSEFVDVIRSLENLINAVQV